MTNLIDQNDLGASAGYGQSHAQPAKALPTLMESLPPALVITVQWLARGAGVLFFLSLAYFIYAVASGFVANFGNPQWGDPRHALSVLQQVGALLVVTGVYLALFAFMALYEQTPWFALLLAAFGLLHFGVPFLFFNQLSLHDNNPAANTILYYLAIIGDACLVFVGIRMITAVVSFLRHGLPTTTSRLSIRARYSMGHSTERKKSPLRMMRRCWETPYCQDALLAVCPAWLKKKVCWKYGSGCMCDPTMMERLIQIEMGPVNPGAQKQKAVRTAPVGPQKCHVCPIYLEHEEEKFKLLSPIAPVVVLGLILYFWSFIDEHYQDVASWIARAVAQVSLGNTQYLAQEWMTTFNDPFVKYGLLVCGTMIVVSYALKLTEWIILEKKL